MSLKVVEYVGRVGRLGRPNRPWYQALQILKGLHRRLPATTHSNHSLCSCAERLDLDGGVDGERRGVDLSKIELKPRFVRPIKLGNYEIKGHCDLAAFNRALDNAKIRTTAGEPETTEQRYLAKRIARAIAGTSSFTKAGTLDKNGKPKPLSEALARPRDPPKYNPNKTPVLLVFRIPLFVLILVFKTR